MISPSMSRKSKRKATCAPFSAWVGSMRGLLIRGMPGPGMEDSKLVAAHPLVNARTIAHPPMASALSCFLITPHPLRRSPRSTKTESRKAPPEGGGGGAPPPPQGGTQKQKKPKSRKPPGGGAGRAPPREAEGLLSLLELRQSLLYRLNRFLLLALPVELHALLAELLGLLILGILLQPVLALLVELRGLRVLQGPLLLSPACRNCQEIQAQDQQE